MHVIRENELSTDFILLINKDSNRKVKSFQSSEERLFLKGEGIIKINIQTYKSVTKIDLSEKVVYVDTPKCMRNTLLMDEILHFFSIRRI